MSNDTLVVERQKQWYIDNAERLKKYRKEYYSRPEVKARIKKWRENNRDKINDSKRRYHENHKEEDNLRMKEYRKTHREAVKQIGALYREKNKERIRPMHKEYERKYRQRWPLKVKAHEEVAKAIRSGSLAKKPCEICGDAKSEAHHDNYNEPLKVRWLCKTCHTEWHINNKAKGVE